MNQSTEIEVKNLDHLGLVAGIIDETIIFHSLQKAQLRSIVKLQLANLSDRLIEQKLALKFADIALDYLAEIGYDPVYGARPLKRAVQRYVETPIAKAILRGEFKGGDTTWRKPGNLRRRRRARWRESASWT